MPRRARPPLTAREIGAYLSGGRAARSLGYPDLTYLEIEDMALRAVLDDTPIAASMRMSEYVYWYMRGFAQEAARERS